MKTLGILFAFVKRDLLVETSYRTMFVLQFTGIIMSVLIWRFVSAVVKAPADPRWTIEVGPQADGVRRITAAVDRGGAALSDLLRALLAGGGTIVACSRREAGLQEVFDQMDDGRGAA